MEKLIVILHYYQQELRVELPMNYIEFIDSLSSIIQLPKEMMNNVNISYHSNLDNKIYYIKNSMNYILFLNTVRNKKTSKLNIELPFNNNEQNEKNNKNNNNNNINNDLNMPNKEEKREEDDLLNNPYKESFYEDPKMNEKEDKKDNFDKILNDMDNECEAIEFSFSEEKKSNEENKEDEKYINKNQINKKNNNLNENKINNNQNYIINNNINSYYGQNKLVDNQIRGVPISMNFNIQCNYCKSSQIEGNVFYCKDCSIFFCPNCEKNIGINHPHCYYKIRNKEQFKEISNIHNEKNNKLKSLINNNNNYNNKINNNQTNENIITDLISEGSKLIGNTFNSVISFFNNNTNQNNNNWKNPFINNNINNTNNINSNQYNNNLNNPYDNNINNNNNIYNNNIINYRNFQQGNNNNRNNNDMKSLVEKAKSQYNLSNISDDEIERALIICKGNIDKAVAILLSNHSM